MEPYRHRLEAAHCSFGQRKISDGHLGKTNCTMIVVFWDNCMVPVQLLQGCHTVPMQYLLNHKDIKHLLCGKPHKPWSVAENLYKNSIIPVYNENTCAIAHSHLRCLKNHRENHRQINHTAPGANVIQTSCG